MEVYQYLECQEVYQSSLLFLELKNWIVIGSALLHISDISQIYYWKPLQENKSYVLLGIRSARDQVLILGQYVTASYQ